MAELNDYRSFVAVIDHGNLTSAGRAIGRSLQAVSRSLALVEKELGVELVRRTTRRSEPTPAGLAFYARLKAALGEIDLARAEVERHGEVISGRIRIGASVLFAPTHLVPVVASFMQRWPGVEIEMVLSDHFVDLVEEHLDLAIRIGELPSSSLRARRLAQLRRVVFATPSYLERNGRPLRLDDLRNHACVVRTFGPEGETWPFLHDGRVIRVPIRGSFRSNDAAACNNAVAAGIGLGMAPFWQIRRLVDDGRVELVLTAFEPPPIPVHVLWVATGGLPARTRAFIDALASRFSAERW